jgi:hypothetical protein
LFDLTIQHIEDFFLTWVMVEVMAAARLNED